MKERVRTTPVIKALVGAVLMSASTHGGVQEFTDKDEWIFAVGEFTTIDFTGFPDGTFITDQYVDVGVVFMDGDDNIRFSPTGFPNDQWGIDGNTAIHLSFDSPQAYIAVDYPGGMKFELFSEGRLIYTSSGFGLGGVGNFAGVLSTDLFDGALLYDWVLGSVFVDDLHFGVPAPGSLVLLALGALTQRRRRPEIRP